jgi:hypothetical protein
MCHSARAAAIAVAAEDAVEADFSGGAERGGYVAVRQGAGVDGCLNPLKSGDM